MMTICHSEEDGMKKVVDIICGLLFIGGIIVAAASCESFCIPGMVAGVAMIALCGIISNANEREGVEK
jgi:hypothetical protein